MRKRFTAYPAARTSALIPEGWFVLAALSKYPIDMKPLDGTAPEISRTVARDD
jgi:hypothetical protein